MADLYRCAYCYSPITTIEPPDHIDIDDYWEGPDEELWDTIQAEHEDDCEWRRSGGTGALLTVPRLTGQPRFQ